MPATNTLPPGVAVNGDAMRRKRQLLGLNITQFARLSGIHLTTISHIERGRRKTVTPATFAKICEHLGLTTPAARIALIDQRVRRTERAAA